MIGLRIQGIEIMVLRFNLRSVRQSKAQPVKNIGNPIQGLGQNMYRPRGGRAPWQRRIELSRQRRRPCTFPTRFFRPRLF